MLKKMLYVLGVTLLLAFSNAQAAKYDAADDPFFFGFDEGSCRANKG